MYNVYIRINEPCGILSFITYCACERKQWIRNHCVAKLDSVKQLVEITCNIYE